MTGEKKDIKDGRWNRTFLAPHRLLVLVSRYICCMPRLRSWDHSCLVKWKDLEYDSLKDDSLRKHWAQQLYRQRNGFSISHSRRLGEILERAASTGLPDKFEATRSSVSKETGRSSKVELIGKPLVPFSGVYSTHAVIRPRSKLEPNLAANKRLLEQSYSFRPPIIFPHQRLPQPKGVQFGPDNFRSISVDPGNWPRDDLGSSSTETTSLPDIRATVSRPFGNDGAIHGPDDAFEPSSDGSEDGLARSGLDSDAMSPQSVKDAAVDYLTMAYSTIRQRSQEQGLRAAELVGMRSESSLQQRKALLEMRKRAEREAAEARLQVIMVDAVQIRMGQDVKDKPPVQG